MAVWQNTKIVVIGLSVLLAGQFGISLRAMVAIKAAYSDRFGCKPVSVKANLFVALFVMTMVVDFIILSLTVVKTYIEYKSMYHSGLIKLIFRDGLIYFAVV